METSSDNKLCFRISSRSHSGYKNLKTFVGRVRWYHDGRYLYSDSTGIHRLTAKEAQKDAELIAADRINTLSN